MGGHGAAGAGNVTALIDAAARRAPDAVALVERDRTVRYGELSRRAAGFAHVLRERGVGPGDRVALALPNGVAFAVALYGALRLGVTVCPLNPQLTDEERRTILTDFAPRVVIDTPCGGDADAVPVADVPGSATPALVLYTSGSTGRPKGAVLSHRAVIAANRAWAGDILALTPADRVLAALPLSHSLGLNAALIAPLVTGAAVVLLERFTPEAAIAIVRAQRVTVFPGVATMFRRILDTGGWSATDFATVRVAASGAAPCPWQLAQAWRRRTGTRILRGYGMTEMFRPISYLDGDPCDVPDSIGRPVPGVEIRVVDEGGDAVAPGGVGELLLHSEASLDGYLGQPEETAAALVDGWFKTGDLVTVSPEGFVTVVGRRKELILRGGYSVYPPEVEAALAAHPHVAEAAVVGVPDPDLGEEVAAFVTLRPGARLSADELVAWCKTRVAGYKCPRTVTVLGELPRTATGKVRKSALVR